MGTLDYTPQTPRLGIDISPEDHQTLKAFAALKGQSIKDHVPGRTLGDDPALDGMSDDEAFEAMADLSEPRRRTGAARQAFGQVRCGSSARRTQAHRRLTR